MPSINRVTINPNFHDLIPPLSAEEYQLLEESILKEGCRDPLVVWPQLPNKETSTTYILLDGHNRYEICRKHQIGFETLEKEFDTEDEAKIWIINNQLGRRNLTREQISYLIGLRYNLEKKEPDGFEDRDLSGDQNDHRGTAEKIAEETGVSAPTVRRNAKFAKAVDKLPAKEKEEVLAGKSKKTKKEIMRREMAKKDKIELGPPSNGMRFAKMAIMDVEKITEDDLEKEQGLYHVKEYLDRRIEDIDTEEQEVSGLEDARPEENIVDAEEDQGDEVVEDSVVLKQLKKYWSMADLYEKELFIDWLKSRKEI